MSAIEVWPSTVRRLAVRKPIAQRWLLAGLSTTWTAGTALAALPFDAMRAGYASAVNAGLIRNSMLASRDFEHAVGALERITLGPLARRV